MGLVKFYAEIVQFTKMVKFQESLPFGKVYSFPNGRLVSTLFLELSALGCHQLWLFKMLAGRIEHQAEKNVSIESTGSSGTLNNVCTFFTQNII